MEEINGWLVVAYVAFSLIMLFVFLVSVGGFLIDEDESLFERRNDSHELFVWRVAQLLGVFQTLLWVVIAAVWPLFLVILVAIYVTAKHCLVCRPLLVRVVRWLFLGFGKYIHPPRRPSFICGND
jgi:hypothetical protein